MSVNAKSNFNLRWLYSKKALLFISLVVIVALTSVSLIPVTSGHMFTGVAVGTEEELRNAIDTSDNLYAIEILESIVLEKPLEIPNDKKIILVTFNEYNPWANYGRDISLIGPDGMDTIIVKSGGYLAFSGALIVTHTKGTTGRGVYIERGGEVYLYGGKIFANSQVSHGTTFTIYLPIIAS